MIPFTCLQKSRKRRWWCSNCAWSSIEFWGWFPSACRVWEKDLHRSLWGCRCRVWCRSFRYWRESKEDEFPFRLEPLDNLLRWGCFRTSTFEYILLTSSSYTILIIILKIYQCLTTITRKSTNTKRNPSLKKKTSARKSSSIISKFKTWFVLAKWTRPSMNSRNCT